MNCLQQRIIELYNCLMRALVDTSAFLAVVLLEPSRDWLIERTKGVEACAPELLPYEMGNALSAMMRRARLTKTEAQAAYESFSRMKVRLLPCDIPVALELSSSHNLYAYDAYFLVAAQKLGCPLITLDRRMRDIATELGLKTPEPNR